MKKIIIRHFGPINDSGELSIFPITVFCGKQGSGKSTIAKLISTLSWLEKSLVRQDVKVKDITKYKHFQNKYCGYQYLTNFFKSNTYIRYEGDAYSFIYDGGHIEITNQNIRDFVMPQIMYVPAERNFMTSIEHAEKIRKLPPALVTMQEEYINALNDKLLDKKLPIEYFAIQYDKLNKVTWLVGDGYKVRMSEAASGLQSVVPLILVTEYLSNKTNKEEQHSLSAEERKKLQISVNRILENDKLDDELKNAALESLNRNFHNDCFWNIVEEPEQNLYPSSQKAVLNILLKALNSRPHNGLIITTHSPYILNYLSLAIKAAQVKTKAKANETILEKLDKIIPLRSCVDESKVSIYEIESDGNIRKLDSYDGVPSDDNFLNASLEESNCIFDKLMDLEDESE
jgi:predicted ATPase